MIRLMATVIVSLATCIPVAAGHLPDQAVTWADFSYINDIASSGSYVYFATTAGIIRYDKMRDRWEEPLTGAAGLHDENIARVWVDVFDRRLLAEISTGLIEYDWLLRTWYPIDELPSLENDDRHLRTEPDMHPPFGFNYGIDGRLIDQYNRYFTVIDVVDDQAGRLWLAVWGLGAAQANSTTQMVELMPYGLLQNHVTTMLIRDGLLWVAGPIYGSRRSGITVYDIEDNSFQYYESGLTTDFPAVDINCLQVDDSTIYVGTMSGLLCLDRESGRVTRRLPRRSGLNDSEVYSIALFGDSVYVGTADGLNLIVGNDDTVRYVRPGQLGYQPIHDLQRFGSSLWIAAASGAYRFLPGSQTLKKLRDPHQVLFGDVYDIELIDSNLWFLAEDGVLRLDARTGETEPFRQPVRSLAPRCLAVNDTIAVVASDKGMTIIFYKNATVFTRDFTVEDGLASNDVYSLLLDGDFIWIGTDRGLTRFRWNNPDRVD